MKNKLVITAMLTAAVGVASLAGCASEQQKQAEWRAQAKISKEQAQAQALAKAPGGTVKEGELEREKGRLIWSFDITGSPGVTEVNVDALSGEVVSVENEAGGKEAGEKN